MLKKTDDIMPFEGSTDEAAVLALKDITKTFPGVKALSEVSLRLTPGKVTALIGENGAGKSTVVKILTGIYQPDGGAILVDGQPTVFSVPQAAADNGVTAIHQETVLFDELSVAENIFLGHAPRSKFGLIDLKSMTEKSRSILAGIGANIDPDHKLKDLGIANKHLVAIARALSIDARVVIMDEPTAALSHKEIEELYELVESLKSQGKAILFISHKFDEIFRIADNFTVFRDGQLIGDGAISDITEADLVKMMVGRDVSLLDLPIFQNVTLPSLSRLSSKGFLKLAEEFKLAREYTERLDLRAASLDTHVGNLSGGNQQKVVIAKWLATQPKVIILDEPTKGVDIGSKAAVHEFMAELAGQGLAVIMVSSEIPEVLGMSDRVIVMREGRIAAELAGDDLQPETLVRHAAGI